jgi:U3 small nucleolar RNA-associated protein 23
MANPDDIVITQCSIRHLYTAEPKSDAHINLAKTFERRRCGHHLLDSPLSTLDCLSAVVDPRDAGTNKFNYVLASQDEEVRARMRTKAGVPLVYVKRSIMILEPMAGRSADVRTKEEREKFKQGVARASGRGGGVLGKREREEDVEEGVKEGREESERKKKRKGPKEPNPLSMKKPKVREPREPREEVPAPSSPAKTDSIADVQIPPRAPKDGKEKGKKPSVAAVPDRTEREAVEAKTDVTNSTNGVEGEVIKKKRKRKHKTSSGIEKAAAPPDGKAAD